ncbi:hypothetical protein Pcinc_014234 [Petrolisthes cinctipes]|uniref:Uncharacterized protein n=1 Tax=Petrolisthes cinctipes TaxID=88211 RepID=A0AAE1KPF2_PETCI|nr:hypothetical protein Pcinc_014234 [Petrolisthes cinctipes]
MADKSPGKPPSPDDGDGRGRTEKHKRSLLSKVSFFENVWWGQARSPSLERSRPLSRDQEGKSPTVEFGEEVFVVDEPDGGPGEKKARREATGGGVDTPPRRRHSSNRSEDDWEWVEDETSTLAEDIERRLEERRRMRSGSAGGMSPTREWVQLRRSTTSGSTTPTDRRGSTPKPWEDALRREASMAEEIEHRLEQHRQEVRQRLESPVKEWPHLRRSPGLRGSRGTTPERDAADRDRTRSNERRRSRESSLSPARQKVERRVVARAEREGGVVTALTASTHTTTHWDAASGKPNTQTHTSSGDLQELDPSSADKDDYQSVEEEHSESVEGGARKRYSRVFVRRTVERTLTTSPSPEPTEQESLKYFSPTFDFSHTTRSRTPSGPRPRIRSRTPSVERILEDEEEDFPSSATHKPSIDTDSHPANENESTMPDAGASSLSPKRPSTKPRESQADIKVHHHDESSTSVHESFTISQNIDRESKHPDERLTMETTSTVHLEGGANNKNETQRYSTRVLIRDRDPSYTKYVVTSRTASRDSLFSNTSSSEDSPGGLDGGTGVPPWVQRVVVEGSEEDHAPGIFRLRSHQYQEHISSMKASVPSPFSRYMIIAWSEVTPPPGNTPLAPPTPPYHLIHLPLLSHFTISSTNPSYPPHYLIHLPILPHLTISSTNPSYPPTHLTISPTHLTYKLTNLPPPQLLIPPIPPFTYLPIYPTSIT